MELEDGEIANLKHGYKLHLDTTDTQKLRTMDSPQCTKSDCSLNHGTLGPPDSIQDLQKVQGEMEAELISAKSGEVVMSGASIETTVTSKSVPSHKTAVMDLRKKEERQRKSRDLSTIRKPMSSITSHTKVVQSSDGVKHHRSVSQSPAGSNHVDLQPSILGKSLQTMGSLSSITIPMRLDALAYLLNHAVMNPYNVMPQGPCLANQCSIASYRNTVPLTYCPCHGGTPVVDCHSVPTHFTQQQYSTNAFYPNQPSINTGYQPGPINSLPSQNYSYADQHTANREMAVHSDRKWEQINSSLSATSIKKWDDTSRPMQTLDEASYGERCKSGFNQTRTASNGNYFRSNSLQATSGNWKSSQNDDREWQDRSFGRSARKFNDDSSSNYKRGDAGDCYKRGGFSRERTFGSDFRTRKRNEEENSWSSSQDSFSTPKQMRWSGIEGSWQQRRGQTGTAKQEANEHFGENYRSKIIASTDKEKTPIFSGKRMTTVEDWDAEYDTEQSKSGALKEKSSVHAKNENTSIREDWETEYAEEKNSTQEGSSQLQQTEEENIDVGTEQIGDRGKKCQSLQDLTASLHSSTSSEVENIFKIMEKDTACVNIVGVDEEKACTVELHAISGGVDSNICEHTDPLTETIERENYRPSVEIFEKSVNDAMKTVKEYEDAIKRQDEESPVMQNVNGPITLIMPSEKCGPFFLEVVGSNVSIVGENMVESISVAENKNLVGVLD
ncbi:uncharacterized protein LOC119965835 [Scyliorhinus canicula]|uniref:uncharacterized protein LOC119965835 n=1 Tax=Scyliorhinus canicula TaxID=7830 RepID=UPI0018F5AF52|nr:uncharacterized protein LOC119965835 [Scyliorhinus canicula]